MKLLQHLKMLKAPHAVRKKLILKDHPEIRELFGYEPLTAVITLTMVCVCLLACVICSKLEGFWFFFTS